MKRYKKINFVLIGLFGVQFFGLGLVAAQNAADICPNPGTSSYASCISSLDEQYRQCSTTHGTGNADWQRCIDEANAEYLTPTGTVPEAPTGDSPADVVIATDCEENDGQELTRENCGIIGLLVNGINFMSALAGMAIIGSIMFAGYQYMTARDNSGQVEAAKKRIIWALIALAMFIFTYAFLNWLVPGGVL